ncbi:MAG: ion channel [Panacagrimonas sp.]
MKRLILRIRRNPSAGLLLVQLLGVVLYPWMEHTTAGRALFGVFGLVVLAAALWVVRRGPWLTWLGFLLALPVAALLLFNAMRPLPELLVLTAMLEAAFYFYATGSLIAYMLQDEFATTDELFAVGATFTLLAWAFAFLYTACQGLIPGSFGAMVDPESARSWMELLFLSFTTLSGVGLGDIIPLKPMARSLVMLEQLAGVMYIALVVSRLIALSVAGRR